MKTTKKAKFINARLDALAGYMFILPFIAGFMLMFATPLIRSLIYSFSEVSISSTTYLGWFQYRKALFEDPNYIRILTETFVSMAYNITGVFILSFVIACILNAKFRGRTLVRAILFLPVIISSGTVLANQNNYLLDAIQARINYQIVGFNQLLGYLMSAIDISSGILTFIVNLIYHIYMIIRVCGVQILLYLAGLQTISPSLYEASSLEGATAWVNFWKITLPMTSPYLLVCWLYTVVDQAGNAGNYTLMNIINETMIHRNYGLGSAKGWIYMICVAVFLSVTCYIISRTVFYYDKN